VSKPSDEQLDRLARLVDATEDREIDCAQMLDRVAGYVQALSDRAELTEHLRQVAQHLKVCPECREELRVLIVAEGLDPATVLAD
jgi:hypothetical protein